MKHALRAWPQLLCSLLLTSSAGASLEFPAEVKRHYGVETLPATPPSCTLCHRSNDGGADTVVRPFGLTLVRLGVVKNSIPSLDSALSQVDQNGSDSDGDGVTDAEELRLGTDPNMGSGETEDPLAGVPFPETGCSFAARPTTTLAEVLALLGVALLAGVRRRR